MPISATSEPQPSPTQAMWLKVLSLEVKEIDSQTYEVAGETGTHIVNITDVIYSCSGCDSFTYRAMCSHISAVMYRKFTNQERFNLAQGFVSAGYITTSEYIGGKLVVKAEMAVKEKRKKK